MKNLTRFAIGMSVAGAFAAGMAVGKTTKEPKFITRDEVKWDDKGGPKLGTLTGDANKGPYVGLLTIPAGFTSPLHTHSGDYEAVMIEGTSSHWLKGEDGTKAKKLTPGSYWTIPGKAEHVSACDKGKDCLMVVWQKTKFDFAAAKEDKPAAPAMKK